VTTIHPGIDERDLGGDGGAFRRARGIDAEAPLIACVGNITRGRGQDVLVRALPHLLAARPGLRCVLQGSPFPRLADRDFSAELDRLAAELGVAEALIRLPEGPVGDLYDAADLVVNPATTHPESFGRVPLEAGLAGTPSVCSRVGVIPDLHTDGRTALLVEPGDHGALIHALQRLLGDRELRSSLAAGSADLARRIADPERSLAAFQAVIERQLRR
jgi:glycosyltransferase involved in cell wall biosynthesis